MTDDPPSNWHRALELATLVCPCCGEANAPHFFPILIETDGRGRFAVCRTCGHETPLPLNKERTP